MRNYVIINGVNSLTIQGLAINNLPPITKPMIRTQREEIDGRDGDIVTELGYSAYDKSMEIGLYGNFDIDAIIKYFTGEGTIVFSNEVDKYYNFKILDQIDYEKLLKFKTATITLHCQPFKYPVEETPIEGEALTVTGSGSNIALENTVVAPMEMKLKGNTIQDGTPTPTTPIPVQVVSGDNSIEVFGKNLFNINGEINKRYDGTIAGTTQNTVSNEDLTTITNAGSQYPFGQRFYIGTGNKVTISTKLKSVTYSSTPSANDNVGVVVVFNDNTTTGFQQVVYKYSEVGQTKSVTFTPTTDYIIVAFARLASSTSATYTNIMVNKGETAETYEPYQSASYPISLSSNLLYNESLPKVQASVIADYVQGIFSLKGTSSGASNLYIIPYTTSLVHLEAGESITFYIERVSGTSAVKFMTYFYPDDSSTTDYTWRVTLNANTSSNKVVKTATKAGTLKNVQFFIDSGVAYDSEVKILVKKGNIENPIWQPYMTPIELCKIGTHQDRLFKAEAGDSFYDTLTAEVKATLDTGSWYKYGAIGKVNWETLGKVTSYTYTNIDYFQMGKPIDSYDYGRTTPYETPYLFQSAIFNNANSDWGNTNKIGKLFNSATINYLWVGFEKGTTLEQVQSLLDGKALYYWLKTPTYTKITDTTLISQLETKMYSFNPQTNITQINADAPFELDVSLSYTNTMNVNNVGNIYAKPILTIEGSGTIGIILNDIEVLSVDLGTDEKITIDVPNLQAYDPDDDTLLNRNVTGDYMKLLINDGDNTIAFSGSVTSATLTNYTRWI